jgi:hypothetical protein
MTGQDRPPDEFSFHDVALNVLAFIDAGALAALVLLLAVALELWAWRVFFGAA